MVQGRVRGGKGEEVGGDNTPIFHEKKGGLRVQLREEDSRSYQNIRVVGVTVSTGWSPACYSWLNPPASFSFGCCSSACRRGCAACGAQPLSRLLSRCHITSGEIWRGTCPCLHPYHWHGLFMSVKVGQVFFMCWSGLRFSRNLLLCH